MQIDQWVFGFKADYDAIESKTKSKSVVVTAGAPPPIPDRHLYGIRQVESERNLPVGPADRLCGRPMAAILSHRRRLRKRTTHVDPLLHSGGRHDSHQLLRGGKNYKSSGWNVGFGVDYDLQGPWSFTAEYNYVKLGKGTNSTFTCITAKGTPPSICTNYANFSLDNIHNSVTLNMFRVGFHYAFNM